MSLLLLVGCCWHIWHWFQLLPSLIPAGSGSFQKSISRDSATCSCNGSSLGERDPMVKGPSYEISLHRLWNYIGDIYIYNIIDIYIYYTIYIYITYYINYILYIYMYTYGFSTTSAVLENLKMRYIHGCPFSSQENDDESLEWIGRLPRTVPVWWP